MPDFFAGETARILDRLRQGDDQARHSLIGRTCERLLTLTSRMLKAYPGVHRWEQTDDVLPNALLRLCRALEAKTPESPQRGRSPWPGVTLWGVASPKAASARSGVASIWSCSARWRSSSLGNALATQEERFISVPEQGGGSLIPDGPLNPGVMHTVATGGGAHLGLYRLETQVTAGNGSLKMSGLGSTAPAKQIEAIDERQILPPCATIPRRSVAPAVFQEMKEKDGLI
jgi:hypothetical protein